VTENRITGQDIDSTTAALNQGVWRLAIERAVSEVEGWRDRVAGRRQAAALEPALDRRGTLRYGTGRALHHGRRGPGRKVAV
jgi:hypothetical protein